MPQQKPVSAAEKPLRSVPPLSRRVCSAHYGARQKLKKCPEPSGNKLSEFVFDKLCALSGARTAPENVWRHHFVEGVS